MEQTAEAPLNDLVVVRRKGGTLRKLKKTQSEGSMPKGNVVSVNDLFGKQNPGGFGSPVIDMAASFTSTGSSSIDEFSFKSHNPLHVPVDEDGMEIIEEEEQANRKPFQTNTRNSTLGRGPRWTFTSLGSFIMRRRSSEKEKI